MTVHAPYWRPVLEADFCKSCGEDWPCIHYRRAHPRCLCGHLRHASQCYSAACGCREFRPENIP
jgi:hypothetical protein